MLPEYLEEVPDIDFKQFTYEACSEYVISVWHMLGRAEDDFYTLFSCGVWLRMIFDLEDYKGEAQRALIRHFIDWYLWQFHIKDVETECYVSGIFPDDSSPQIGDMARETIVLVSKIREKRRQSDESDESTDDAVKEKKVGLDETESAPSDSVDSVAESFHQHQADANKIKIVSANVPVEDSSNAAATVALGHQQQADATEQSTETRSVSKESIAIVPHVAKAHSPVQQKRPGSIKSVPHKSVRAKNNDVQVPAKSHIVGSPASEKHSPAHLSPIHTTNSVPQQTESVMTNADIHHLASRSTVNEKSHTVPISAVHQARAHRPAPLSHPRNRGNMVSGH